MTDSEDQISGYMTRTREEKKQELEAEIPQLKRIIENMGDRVKEAEAKIDTLERSMKYVLPFVTEIGARELKRKMCEFIIKKIRKDIVDSGRYEVRTNKDLLRLFKVHKKGEEVE